MKAKDRLIVALDVDTMKEVQYYVEQLRDEVGMFKIGMQVYHSLGGDVVSMVKKAGAKVFLDLKLHDIPNTVEKTVRVLTRLGVDMVNVHSSGGRLMMEKALEGARDEASKAGISPPKVIAVTILTSLGKLDMTEIGYRDEPDTMVRRLSLLAKDAGLDGVVCSPLEAGLVKDACGKDFITVTPGVRPAEGDKQDQKRVMTPGRAIEAGADYLVVGRPVRNAPDPRKAARSIVQEMEDALC